MMFTYLMANPNRPKYVFENIGKSKKYVKLKYLTIIMFLNY